MSLFSVDMERAALISDDGLYRYRLSRRWSDERVMTWVMLNPSTADALTDDPTIRRCMGFARREGCGAIDVVNLFAYRATDPEDLFHSNEAGIRINGPENSKHVQQALLDNRRDGGIVVVGWGASWPRHRLNESVAHSRCFATWMDCREWQTRCLGTTKDGAPRHPLFVRGDAPLQPWGNWKDEA